MVMTVQRGEGKTKGRKTNACGGIAHPSLETAATTLNHQKAAAPWNASACRAPEKHQKKKLP
jgi:hypothetical protein